MTGDTSPDPHDTLPLAVGREGVPSRKARTALSPLRAVSAGALSFSHALDHDATQLDRGVGESI